MKKWTSSILAAALVGCFSMAHADNAAECKPLPKVAKQYSIFENCGEDVLRFMDTKSESTHNVGLMNGKGEIVVPAQYVFITRYETQPSLFVANTRVDDKLHNIVIDIKGNTIMDFDENVLGVDLSANNIVAVKHEDGEIKRALFDLKGKQLTPFKYTVFSGFDDGLAVVSSDPVTKYGEDNKDLRMGFVDEQGKEVIAPQFKELGKFAEGTSWVADDKGDRWAIDKTGAKLWKVPYAFKDISLSTHGLVRLANDDTSWVAVVDAKTGREVVPAGKFDDLSVSDYAPVIYAVRNHLVGLLDLNGKTLVEPAYDTGDESEDGEPYVRLYRHANQTVDYVNMKGEVIQSRPAKFAKACAHVKLDAPAVQDKNMRVRDWNAERNQVAFADLAAGDTVNGTCDDVAKSAVVKKARGKKK
ncbi:WG repeat-containing protein [Kingella negevensis]|uniref:WG repeat-containing protein n=1 Tax=Kingella negevensis TaxID=1522312 RepID=UPI00050A28BC|nr:WG repeat-containing protein [Kingella negevensis]MDK4679335.1 WG repeat-containing protein [Kingella negevensis]MDK4682945.1 WG repeat-containing protein [Kingella negevensis]MDK4688375.1 WG repeat-containing protein [Kingella negevensis]MDK4691144.1 WG repeat-containing protein [Kingella negevensis]MDK4693708.1 WG repeat-containing protein [Kingella negevensis]